MQEKLGRRIADLRTDHGMTQQEVAERLGLSRVAISQFEAGMSLPSERTVILLASLFKIEPPDLVAGTGYPMAKAERLPPVVVRHTEVELQLARCELDLEWVERVDDPVLRRRVADDWRDRLVLLAKTATRHEAQRIKDLRGRLD
jgi:transcriptional regulator with XRE-family HTH domain